MQGGGGLHRWIVMGIGRSSMRVKSDHRRIASQSGCGADKDGW